jgi:hypothetical protein
VKNIQIGATRASYGNRRAPNLQIRSSSQGSSFGSFESQSNPYGGTGGLRLDKIVSICSTISDDIREQVKGTQKYIIGYSPRAFGPKGMAFGVQLRRIDNPTINTLVPLIGDGVVPDDTDDINQSRVDQPQAPVTGTDRAFEMRTLLPVSNFSNPPTPKNNNSPSLNLFRTSFDRLRSKESLEFSQSAAFYFTAKIQQKLTKDHYLGLLRDAANCH